MITNFYANQNKIKYNDGFFFGLNETELYFTEYQIGQNTEMSRDTSNYQPYAEIFLKQGLKQTETVYTITNYSYFIGNFAALVLSAYSALGYIMSRFQDLRVDAL